MKKNWIMRSAYLTLAVLLISTVVVSGTFARYTWATDESITDIARVANFSFKISKTTVETGNEDIIIDLFNTIYDTDTTDGEEATDGELDVDAKGADDKTLIAPGVQGSFNLNFQNLSEVTVAVDFTAVLTKSNENIPLEFTLTPDVAESWNKDAAVVIDGLDDATVLTTDDATDAIVYWRWVFDGNSDVDTALGFGANSGDITAQLAIDVAVDQVD